MGQREGTSKSEIFEQISLRSHMCVARLMVGRCTMECDLCNFLVIISPSIARICFCFDCCFIHYDRVEMINFPVILKRSFLVLNYSGINI